MCMLEVAFYNTCVFTDLYTKKIMCTFGNVSTWTCIVAHILRALYAPKVIYEHICILKEPLLYPLGHCYALIVVIQKDNHLVIYLFEFCYSLCISSALAYQQSSGNSLLDDSSCKALMRSLITEFFSVAPVLSWTISYSDF